MLTKILGSRGVMSVAVILVFVVAAAVGLKLSKPSPDMRTYCAEMPDSIGLYKDSAVTIMGVPVGKVTDIRPDGPSAKIRFTVPADRTLPPNVSAVTVSNTLIADRRLALIGAEPAGRGWDSGRCITKTLTPKSMSETFDALAKLADQLDAAKDPAQRGGLDALDRATAGTGDQINTIVMQLSKALAAPDAAIGHIGQLLDDLTDLAHRARNGWPTAQASITGLTQTFSDINTLAFPPVIEIVTALTEVLPQLNDVIMMLGSPALRALDAIPDLPKLISAGVGSLADIIRMSPAIETGFAGAIDPATGQFTIGYKSPALALPQHDSAQVCAALQTITRQRCQTAANGAVSVPALPTLLSAVSTR